MIGAWNTAADAFPVGSFARVTAGNTPTEGAAEFAGMVGRVVFASGRMVHVRFPGNDVCRYDADWLHRVVFVRSRYYGPGMSPRRSEFIGARIIVTGTRGNRSQLTIPYDHAIHTLDNHMSAVRRFARERLDMCAPEVETITARRGVLTHIITEYGTCECSDEFGPCEFHGEELAQRVGSSNRSADELCAVFLSDAADALADNGSAFPADWEDIRTMADDPDSWSGSWLADDATVPGASDGYMPSDALRDAVSACESALAGVGLSVWWDDGYRIVRVTGGPLSR